MIKLCLICLRSILGSLILYGIFFGSASILANDVNPSMGSVVQSVVDLALPGKNGLDIAISRHYNSQFYQSSHAEEDHLLQQRWAGYMGNGWSSSVGNRLMVMVPEERLTKVTGSVTVEANGGLTKYDWDEEKQHYTSSIPNDLTRVIKDGDEYVVETSTGIKYIYGKQFYYEKNYRDRYEAGGWFDYHTLTYEDYFFIYGYHLTRITDAFGNEITYAYEEYMDSEHYDFEDKKINFDQIEALETEVGERIGNFHPFKAAHYDMQAYIYNTSGKTGATDRLGPDRNNQRWYNRAKNEYFFRPSSITDTYGRTISFAYTSNERDMQLNAITYTGMAGTIHTILYAYDADKNLMSVINGPGPETTYSYADYVPSFKKYKRKDGNRDYISVEFSDSTFIQGENVEVMDDMAKYNGWLLETIVDPLGRTTRYTYEDYAFFYLKKDAIETAYEDEWVEKQLHDAYTHPVIHTKTVTGSTSSINGASTTQASVTYTYSYPKSDGHLYKTFYKFSDTFEGFELESLSASNVSKVLVTQSEDIYDGLTTAYFSSLTQSSSADEAPITYRWGRGQLMSQTQDNLTLDYDYYEDFKKKTIKVTKGGHSITTTYDSYDEYGNATQVSKMSSDGTLSTTTYTIYADDPDLISNRFFHLPATSYARDLLNNKTTPTTIKTYTSTGKVASISESYNGQTRQKESFTYTGNGRLATKTVADQATIHYSYDDNSTYSDNLYSSIDTIKKITTTQSGSTQFVTTLHADLYTERPVYKQDATGEVITYTYDDYARLTNTTYPDGNTKAVRYSDDLKKVTVTALGLAKTVAIDDFGRKVWVDYPEGVEDILYTYEGALKRLASIYKGQVNSDGVLTDSQLVKSMRYSNFGRDVSTYNPNWGTSTITHNDSAQTKTTTDFAGRTTETTHNDWQKIVSQSMFKGTNGELTYTYGHQPLGTQSWVRDGRDLYHVTEEIKGWESTTYHPSISLSNLDEQEKVIYRADGKMASFTLSGKDGTEGEITFQYDYDDFGRLKGVSSEEDGQLETYIYDENGHGNSIGKLTHSNNDDVEQAFIYDEIGRLVKEETTVKSTQVSMSVARSFNEHGFLSKTSYADGSEITYTYDDLKRIKSIAYNEKTIATYSYLINGQVEAIAYSSASNGANTHSMESSYDYDKESLVTGISFKHPTSGKVSEATYRYNTKGHVTYFEEPSFFYGGSKKRKFTYSDRDELEGVLNGYSGDIIYSYTYDNNGNVVSAKQPSSEGILDIDMSVDNRSDELKSVVKTSSNSSSNTNETEVNSIDTIDYAYDFAGNVIQKQTNDAIFRFTYNWQHQISTYKEEGEEALTARYLYNNDRERVFSSTTIKKRGSNKAAKTQNTYYIWDSGQIIGEQDADGRIHTKYIYSGNEKLAVVRTNENGIEDIYIYLNNPQGTPLAVVDETGTVVHAQSMDPWGNLEQGVFGSKDEVNYTGKKKDRASGLFYFNQRYYDADTYRFMQRDPAKQLLNPYVYAGNNPLVYVDPDGEWFFTTMLSAFGPLGTMVGAAIDAGMTAAAIDAGFQVANHVISEGGFNFTHFSYDTERGSRSFLAGAAGSVIGGFLPDIGDSWYANVIDAGLARGVGKMTIGAIGQDLKNYQFGDMFISGFYEGASEALIDRAISGMSPTFLKEYGMGKGEIEALLVGDVKGYVMARGLYYGFEHFQVFFMRGAKLDSYGVLGKENLPIGNAKVGREPIPDKGYRKVRALNQQELSEMIDNINKAASELYILPFNNCVHACNL